MDIEETNEASASIEDLTIERYEDGELVRKQVAKEIIAKGTWPIILFLYQDLGADGFSESKVAIRRFRKFRGSYRAQPVNMTKAQAEAMAAALCKWFGA